MGRWGLGCKYSREKKRRRRRRRRRKKEEIVVLYFVDVLFSFTYIKNFFFYNV